MIESLELRHIGPAEQLGPLDFGRRINVLTGDNGLGKTFLLDIIFRMLTGAWPGRPAWPAAEVRKKAQPPEIIARVRGKAATSLVSTTFDAAREAWISKPGRPHMPGLLLYFRVDGRFSLWDPAQHYWRRSKDQANDSELSPALHLHPDEVWNTVVSADGKVISRGLIEDWVTWQQTNSPQFAALKRTLERLSTTEPLEPGQPTRISIEDIRSHPTLSLPYGEVPVVFASAGAQRILAISYLLVWSWFAHREAAALLGQEAESRMVVLFDEIETHLHPQWQRRLLPALLAAISELPGSATAQPEVQLLVSTHSPLVLASWEPDFDPELDQLITFTLDPETRKVQVETPPFYRRGDVLGWLVSEVFGLEQARSVPAEVTIEAAESFMRNEAGANPPQLRTLEAIHTELKRLLPGDDPFWPRWLVKTEQL